METEKRFSSRRFISVIALWTFALTGISGLVLLFSHGYSGNGYAIINLKKMHDIG